MKKRQVPTSKDRKAEKPKKQTTVKISPEIDLGESLKNNVVQIKRFKKVSKNTSKQGCINRHKQITKYSGRTENQIPYSTYCGKIIIKG